jgi:hypothetical protein
MSYRLVVVPLLLASLLTAQAGRALAGSTTCLEVDGKCRSVQGVTGGEAVLDCVVINSASGARVAQKALSNPHIEPLRISADPTGFLPWINDFMAGRSQPVDFAVVRAGMDGKVTSRTEVTRASLVEVALDPLDAASRTPFGLTLEFQPERAKEGKVGDAIAMVGLKERKPVANAFRVAIPGVDCSGARARAPSLGVAGSARRQPMATGLVEVNNPTIMVMAGKDSGFLAWHRSSVLEGHCSPADWKDVSIELLGPDLKTVVMRLEAKAGLVAARKQEQQGQLPELAVELVVDGWRISN